MGRLKELFERRGTNPGSSNELEVYLKLGCDIRGTTLMCNLSEEQRKSEQRKLLRVIGIERH